MSRVRITQPFRYAYGGVRVVTHVVGTEISADDEAAKVALAEKWGELIETGASRTEGKKPERRKKD